MYRSRVINTGLMACLLAFGLVACSPYSEPEKRAGKTHSNDAVPVEVAPVEHGPIELHRSFTSTLEAQAEFVVAPKVSGLIKQLHVDLADSVQRDQIVALLDDAEYVQEVAQAEAELAVAKANHSEAHSLLNIAERELKRLHTLRERGDISESQLDAARAEQLAKQAAVDVSLAEITRAEAELAAARIRLSYTQVRAGWQDGRQTRLVAERHVDTGETVAANTPLYRIVELDPLTVVFHVTERDYAHLQPGQTATIHTDAYGDEAFSARVARIAPVFRESTRQARVELTVDNPEQRLKPGMFARATVILQHVDDATIVPLQALTRRDERDGVFVVGNDQTAIWHAVEIGIEQDDRLQIISPPLSGQVVTLGQQALDHGSALRVVE